MFYPFLKLGEFPFQLDFLELGRFSGVGRGSVVQGVPGAAARQRQREVGRRLRVVRAEHLHRHEARPLVSECASREFRTCESSRLSTEVEKLPC